MTASLGIHLYPFCLYNRASDYFRLTEVSWDSFPGSPEIKDRRSKRTLGIFSLHKAKKKIKQQH